MFERTDDPQDTYMAEDAKVLGPVNSVEGDPGDRQRRRVGARPADPAESQPRRRWRRTSFKEIVTAKGVYTYDQSKQDYSYKSHYDLAAEAKAARDEYWKQVDEKQWQRRKESYKLGTDRLRAVYAILLAAVVVVVAAGQA